ncbi:hypothetical protein MMC06_000931 [Schaereria dolodes]|nr:hypothetical protein [Schaereria dolodes]
MTHSRARSSSINSLPKSSPGPTNPLESSLATAQARYTLRNPLSLDAHNDSCQHLPGGNTRTVLHSTPFPLTFTSGTDCSLTTLDGHTYTDFLGEYTAGIYGHSHATIRAAIDDVLTKGWNLGGNNVYEKRLAKLVCERFSSTMELVRFTNSGTEANMMSLATAMAWTGRKKILVFSNGYHGSTLSFPPKIGNSINLPHEWVVAPYNDLKKTRAILFGLPTASLAAILVEPMLGSGGAVPGDLVFLQYLREAATQYGALLIFDEVMTSRLSYQGLGHKLGIQPDLMTLGKWVGGGMSFGAFGGRKDIMGMYDPRSGILHHPGTFNNNVFSMAAGCAGCELLDATTIDKLNDLGELMKGMIRDVLHKHEIRSDQPSIDGVENGLRDINISNGTSNPLHSNHVGSRMWVSGVGSILGVYFGGESKDILQGLFFHHMLEENIYLSQRGFMALSIVVQQSHVQHFVEATERFVLKYKHALSYNTPSL